MQRERHRHGDLGISGRRRLRIARSGETSPPLGGELSSPGEKSGERVRARSGLNMGSPEQDRKYRQAGLGHALAPWRGRGYDSSNKGERLPGDLSATRGKMTGNTFYRVGLRGGDRAGGIR